MNQFSDTEDEREDQLPVAGPGSPAGASGVPRARINVPVFPKDPREGLGPWNDRALYLLESINDPPVIFWRRSDGLVVIRRDRDGAKLETLTPQALRHLICDVSNWVETTFDSRNRERMKPVTANFMLSIATNLLEAPVYDRFPEIDAVIESPTFVAGGRLVSREGYDAATRLYLAPPRGFTLPVVPDQPSKKLVELAVRFLKDEILADFPFDGPGALANAFAMLLGPIARRLISSPTPLHMISSPVPETGKSTLAKLANIPPTGRLPGMKPQVSTDDELRKNVTATLLACGPVVLFDNIAAEVSGPIWAALLTSEIWEDRQLQTSKNLKLPNTATYIATANLPTFAKDCAQRTVLIPLDAFMEDPGSRKFRTLMPNHAIKHRTQFLHALLVLVQRWIFEGQVRGKTGHNRFPEWAEVIGGILECAGIEAFLTIPTPTQPDPESTRFNSLVKAWLATGNLELSLSEILKLIEGNQAIRVHWIEAIGQVDITNVKESRLSGELASSGPRIWAFHRIVRQDRDRVYFRLVKAATPTATAGATTAPAAPPTPPEPELPEEAVAARRRAEKMFPSLLKALGGDRDEARRFGQRLDADEERSKKVAQGPGELLAEKLFNEFLKKGGEHFPDDPAKILGYVQFLGLFLTERAELEQGDEVEMAGTSIGTD